MIPNENDDDYIDYHLTFNKERFQEIYAKIEYLYPLYQEGKLDNDQKKYLEKLVAEAKKYLYN